jgi:hypothetical protein
MNEPCISSPGISTGQIWKATLENIATPATSVSKQGQIAGPGPGLGMDRTGPVATGVTT